MWGNTNLKTNAMKQSINCCDYFEKMRHNFEWFSYQDENNKKVYFMPTLRDCNGHTKLRVNYCPSCGKEVRAIELKEL